MLFIEGFREVDGLSERIVELFLLCSKMLSPQRHYDWGLRELKTILTACGNTLRASRPQEQTKTLESDVIASVLRTSISSKMTVQDSNIFQLLMSIIFPSANPKGVQGSEQVLIDGLTRTFTDLGLVVNNRQLGKCLELHDQLTKRMGVMVVGKSGTGKTTLINALRQTLMREGQQIRTITISPKSMPLKHLLGQLDEDTRQWRDGVLTTTAQTVVATSEQETNVRSWIICDGDVDPVWIEALNSVLDDNKLLTLPSGWRIQFGGNVNFLFETHDLQHASPATISRLGIINVNPEDFPETLFVDRFYLHQPPIGDDDVGEEHQIIKLFIEKYLWRAIDWLQQSAAERDGGTGRTATDAGFMPFPSVVGRSNWINWALQAIGNQNNNNYSRGRGEDKNNYVTSAPRSLERALRWSKERFCGVLVNSLGCALPTDDDKVAFIKAIMYDCMELPQIPCPDDQLVYLYFDQSREVLDVYRGSDEGVIASRASSMDRLLIRTPQVNGYLNVLQDFLINESTPFLIVGPSGAGKSLLIQEAVHLLEEDGYQLISINCSAQLSADHIRHVLRESSVVLSGPRGKEHHRRRAIVFLKNMNLLRVDCYGTSDVVELLLEIVYRSGFYATATADWIGVTGLQLCGSLTLDPAAMSATRQGFNKLSPRFINLCRYLIVAQPQATDLQMIITLQLKCLSFVNWKIRPQSIAGTILGVFNELRERLLSPTHKQQYEFSPKLMSRTIAYLQRYHEDNLLEAVAFELTQIFRNRLSTADDVKTFDEILSNNLRSLAGNGDVQTLLSAFMPERMGEGRQRIYSREELLRLVEPHIEVCNNEDVRIEVPLTEQLLQNVLAVARVCVVCQPNSHLVLCGSVGGGRREAVHIVAQLMQFKLHTIQATRNYGRSDFYNDLRAAMQSAGLENANTVLLIDFTWLNHCPEIMVPVEAILEGSAIPELFGDDLENVAAPLKQAAQHEGAEGSLGEYFMKRTLIHTGELLMYFRFRDF